MAFLDNSGDILLDAVLTDIGRKRLAEGRFNIYKFALGDEEINYELWNSADTRGSAWYDLEILQTPLLEAFTSDQSLMKSRLLSFSRTDLLYLPMLKINNKETNTLNRPYNDATSQFNLIADSKTATKDGAPDDDAGKGFLPGIEGYADKFGVNHIAIDQGINSSGGGQNITTTLDPELLESAYIVKCDHRLIRLSTLGSDMSTITPRTWQYLDDDYVASYYLARGQVDGAIRREPHDLSDFRSRSTILPGMSAANLDIAAKSEMFPGARGRTLQIVPRVTTEIELSSALFDELGAAGSGDLAFRGGNIKSGYKYIDTSITVQGMTTGYSIDIPIKIIKGVTFD